MSERICPECKSNNTWAVVIHADVFPQGDGEMNIIQAGCGCYACDHLWEADESYWIADEGVRDDFARD